MAFSVFIAFLSYNYSAVGSLFYSTSYLPPFFAAFLSSFLGGGAPLPPFLFLSSTTSYYLFSILKASEINF